MNNKKYWFTLIEIIIAITSFFVLLVIIVNLYNNMIKLKYNIEARENLIQNTYFAFEKINLLLKDYTIDYEEYFNRKNVWCDSNSTIFSRNVWINWYCDIFTSYGNYNNIDLFTTSKHRIYYCSSQDTVLGETKAVIPGLIWEGSWCGISGYQSFWEYYRQFRDIKNNVDNVASALWDEDDEDIMKWPEAIENATWVQELYLISQDGKQRIYFRRALVESGDRNHDIIISWDTEKLYTIQILKLRWFDAWNNHDFDITNSSWVYDGKIDTRACDYAQWFICSWSNLWTIYSWYRLPADANDGRVNLFEKNLTTSNRNLTIYPTKNPYYALAEDSVQINPYFTISLRNKLYWSIWQKKLWLTNSIDDFQLNLQTTFNTKNNYTK